MKLTSETLNAGKLQTWADSQVKRLVKLNTLHGSGRASILRGLRKQLWDAGYGTRKQCDEIAYSIIELADLELECIRAEHNRVYAYAKVTCKVNARNKRQPANV